MSKYECTFCGNYFTRKTYLKKHENICRMLHLSKRERDIETEELEVLDNTTLTKIKLFVNKDNK